MAAATRFNSLSEALAEKIHNLGSDTLRILLSNVAPVATNTQKSNLTEISAGNGYSAGGPSATISSSAQSSGLYKLVLADVTITASGGSIGPFRYVVLYDDTATNDELIEFWDYGSSITLADGESFVVDFDPTTGALQLT